jgi:hypothetical protein
MPPFVAMLFLPLHNTSKGICSASRTTSSNPLAYEYDADMDTDTKVQNVRIEDKLRGKLQRLAEVPHLECSQSPRSRAVTL